MRSVTVKLPKELLELLNWYAINHKKSRSEVIREAIKKLLKEDGLLSD